MTLEKAKCGNNTPFLTKSAAIGVLFRCITVPPKSGTLVNILLFQVTTRLVFVFQQCSQNDVRLPLSTLLSTKASVPKVENRQSRTKLIFLEQCYRTLDEYYNVRVNPSDSVHIQVSVLSVDSRQSELR